MNKYLQLYTMAKYDFDYDFDSIPVITLARPLTRQTSEVMDIPALVRQPEPEIDIPLGYIPPRAPLTRIIVPGSWSEIYRKIKEVEPDEPIRKFTPAPVHTGAMDICKPLDPMIESIFGDKQEKIVNPGAFKFDFPPGFIDYVNKIKIVQEPDSVQEQYAVQEPYAVQEIKPLSACLKPLDESYDLYYITHYGIDAYLIHIYGNNSRANEMMQKDDIYVAQNKFISSEYFSR